MELHGMHALLHHGAVQWWPQYGDVRCAAHVTQVLLPDTWDVARDGDASHDTPAASDDARSADGHRPAARGQQRARRGVDARLGAVARSRRPRDARSAAIGRRTKCRAVRSNGAFARERGGGSALAFARGLCAGWAAGSAAERARALAPPVQVARAADWRDRGAAAADWREQQQRRLALFAC